MPVVEHVLGEELPARGVDRMHGLLVGDEHFEHAFVRQPPPLRRERIRRIAHFTGGAARSYASTMSCTMRWRTTSRLVSRTNAKAVDAGEHLLEPERPLRPPGTSTCVTSPVTTTFEPKPMRVRNIFICSGVVFCASSRMMKLLLSVRPRMKASGATSTVPRSSRRCAPRARPCRRARRRAAAGTDRPSP